MGGGSLFEETREERREGEKSKEELQHGLTFRVSRTQQIFFEGRENKGGEITEMKGMDDERVMG